MALLEAIQRFVNEFNQEERNFGKLTVCAEKKEIQEELLPEGELKTFYAIVDFDKLTIGNTFFLYVATLAELPATPVSGRMAVGLRYRSDRKGRGTQYGLFSVTETVTRYLLRLKIILHLCLEAFRKQIIINYPRLSNRS